MQNSRFLRGVIVMQKSYNETITELYKALYINEYVVDNNDLNKGYDLNRLTISLPSPANLNMTNLADQLSTVSGVIDFVTQTIAGQSSDGPEVDNIRRIVTEKYITNIDWMEIKELIKDSKKDEIAEQLLKPKGDSNMDSDY